MSKKKIINTAGEAAGTADAALFRCCLEKVTEHSSVGLYSTIIHGQCSTWLEQELAKNGFSVKILSSDLFEIKWGEQKQAPGWFLKLTMEDLLLGSPVPAWLVGVAIAVLIIKLRS